MVINKNNHTRDIAHDKTSQAIFLFGVPRSGTFILGKIIHSFKNVECTFEPPTLLSLFSLINKIDESSWKLLFETHLFEDFFMNALAGRSINCNRIDDSSVYHSKEEGEIEKRLTSTFRETTLQEICKNGIIACKLSFISPELLKLKKWYPNLRVLSSLREAEDVISSYLVKDWYSDKNFQRNSFVKPHILKNNYCIPFWIPEVDYDLWINFSQIEKIAYDYIYMSRQIKKSDNNVIWYSDLVNKPKKTIQRLSKSMKVDWGTKTEGLVSTISRKTNRTSRTILNNVSIELREELNYWNDFNKSRGSYFTNE